MDQQKMEQKKYNSEYYQKNKNKWKKYNTEYYESNKDKIKKVASEYYQKNKDKILKKMKDNYDKKRKEQRENLKLQIELFDDEDDIQKLQKINEMEYALQTNDYSKMKGFVYEYEDDEVNSNTPSKYIEKLQMLIDLFDDENDINELDRFKKSLNRAEMEYALQTGDYSKMKGFLYEYDDEI